MPQRLLEVRKRWNRGWQKGVPNVLALTLNRMKRRTPPALRLRLVVLCAFAVVPFGGVTVPLWRVLRRRLWEVTPGVERDGAAPHIGNAMVSVE